MEVIEQTDAKEWDALIGRIGGHPLQTWPWGALKERFGWRPVRIATDDGAAAAQVLFRPLAGLSVAYVPRGPALSGDDASDDALLEGITRQARRARAAFVRFEPDVHLDTPQAELLRSLLDRHGYRAAGRTLQPRASLLLNLEPTPDELFAQFSKGHRADVRRAEREGVSVRAGSARDAEVLHGLLRETQARKSFGIHSAAYYRVLMEAFGERACLLIAEHDGTAVAAALVLATADDGVYLAAGSNAAGLAHRAGHLVQWHAIQWARERGARRYDLWGIAEARAELELDTAGDPARTQALEERAKSDPLDGVYRFKKGWGAHAVRYVPAYDRVRFPPAYWLWQRRRGGEA